MKKVIKRKGELVEVDSNDLVELYGKLAVYLTRTWTNQYEQDDLVSTAYFGLWKAFRNYKDTSIEFATYMGVILNNELRILHRRNNRESLIKDYISLESPISNEVDGLTIGDMIQDKTNIEEDFLHNFITNEAIKIAQKSTMDERKKKIIKLYYCDELNQTYISKIFGLSQSYVSRIINKAERAVREHYLQEIS